MMTDPHNRDNDPGRPSSAPPNSNEPPPGGSSAGGYPQGGPSGAGPPQTGGPPGAGPPQYGPSQQYGQQGYGPQGYGRPAPPYPAAPASSPTRAPGSGLGQATRIGLVTLAVSASAAFVVSLLASVILLAGGGFDSFTNAADTGDLGSDFGQDIAGSASFAMPFIVWALALGGSAKLAFEVRSESFSGDFALTLVAVPLLVSAVAVGVTYWWSRFSERRSPGRTVAAVWLRIGVTAVGYAVALVLLELIFAARFDFSPGFGASMHVELSALTARTFLLPLIVIGAATAVGRASGHPYGLESIGASFLRRAIPAVRAAGVHFVVAVGLMTLVCLMVFLFKEGWRSADLLASGVAGIYLTVLGHLGAVRVAGGGDFLDYSSAASDLETLFSSDLPGYLWLSVVVAVVAVLVASAALAASRFPQRTSRGIVWTSCWEVPLAFAVLWGLASLVVLPIGAKASGSASMLQEMGSGGLSFSVSAAAWVFLIFAAWGLLVDVLSRTVMPSVVMTAPTAARFVAGRALHPWWAWHLRAPMPANPLIRTDDGTAPVSNNPLPNNPVPNNPASNVSAASNYSSRPDYPARPNYPAGPGNPMAPNYSGPSAAGRDVPRWSGAAAIPPPRRIDKRKLLTGLIACGVVVLLIVAGSVAYSQVNSKVYGPSAVVAKYFDYLSDGKASKALELADSDVPDNERALMTDKILSASTDRVDDVDIQNTETNGDMATVRVRYDVGGRKSTVSVNLHKSGRQAGIFDKWIMTAPNFGGVVLGDAGGLKRVSVNGIDVKLPSNETTSLPAFPAVYKIGLPSRAKKYLAAKEVTVRPTDSAAADDGLTVTPNGRFVDAVKKQVKSKIDECAKSTSLEPEGCPFSSYESATVHNVKWSITKYPSISVDTDTPSYQSGESQGPAWDFSSDDAGIAKITGKMKYPFDNKAEPIDDENYFSVSGYATVTGGKVIVHMSDY